MSGKNGWRAAGAVLLTAAVCLTAYNVLEGLRAKRDTALAVSRVEALLPLAVTETVLETASEPEVSVELPEVKEELPAEAVDEWEYAGLLRIPVLGLELPVISQWSYPALRAAPCRYQGGADTGNLILAGHNYPAHFGRVKALNAGDVITFTDMDGQQFCYEVMLVEILAPTAVEALESGSWELTLFTCTVGGQSRVVVRCTAVESASRDRERCQYRERSAAAA